MKKLQTTHKELTPRMKQVVELVFSPEHLTQQEIGARLGITHSRVSQILRCRRVLNAYPVIARRYKQSLIPKAIRAQDELITQTRDLNVRDKASARLLESEGILDKQPVVIRHELEIMSTEKVIASVRDSLKSAGADVYDAEVVDPEDDKPADQLAE